MIYCAGLGRVEPSQPWQFEGGLQQAFAQGSNLAGQRVDLQPLLGDRLVQRLDGLILKHQPGLKRVNALEERF